MALGPFTLSNPSQGVYGRSGRGLSMVRTELLGCDDIKCSCGWVTGQGTCVELCCPYLVDVSTIETVDDDVFTGHGSVLFF